MEVSFRMHDKIEVCEIRRPDGSIGVFPARDNEPSISTERGLPVTFAEAYPKQYRQFKAGADSQPPIPEQKEPKQKPTKSRKAKA